MLQLDTTNRFEREIARAARRGKKLEKLWKISELLQAGIPLPVKHRNHKLTGNWVGHFECHIEPDWLLIYEITGTKLLLVATGTHTDLFD